MLGPGPECFEIWVRPIFCNQPTTLFFFFYFLFFSAWEIGISVSLLAAKKKRKQRKRRHGASVVGGGTSSGDHRRDALHNGQCPVFHPQGRTWPCNPTPSRPTFLSLSLSGMPLLFIYLMPHPPLIDLDWHDMIGTLSTLAMTCGTWPWSAGTRSSWNSPPLSLHLPIRSPFRDLSQAVFLLLRLDCRYTSQLSGFHAVQDFAI